MGFVDIALMAVIIAGAVYLLYRSVWKKKGHCPGCDSDTCGKGDLNKNELKLREGVSKNIDICHPKRSKGTSQCAPTGYGDP